MRIDLVLFTRVPYESKWAHTCAHSIVLYYAYKLGKILCYGYIFPTSIFQLTNSPTSIPKLTHLHPLPHPPHLTNLQPLPHPPSPPPHPSFPPIYLHPPPQPHTSPTTHPTSPTSTPHLNHLHPKPHLHLTRLGVEVG